MTLSFSSFSVSIFLYQALFLVMLLYRLEYIYSLSREANLRWPLSTPHAPRWAAWHALMGHLPSEAAPVTPIHSIMRLRRDKLIIGVTKRDATDIYYASSHHYFLAILAQFYSTFSYKTVKTVHEYNQTWGDDVGLIKLCPTPSSWPIIPLSFTSLSKAFWHFVFAPEMGGIFENWSMNRIQNIIASCVDNVLRTTNGQ